MYFLLFFSFIFWHYNLILKKIFKILNKTQFKLLKWETWIIREGTLIILELELAGCQKTKYLPLSLIWKIFRVSHFKYGMILNRWMKYYDRWRRSLNSNQRPSPIIKKKPLEKELKKVKKKKRIKKHCSLTHFKNRRGISLFFKILSLWSWFLSLFFSVLFEVLKCRRCDRMANRRWVTLRSSFVLAGSCDPVQPPSRLHQVGS